MVQGKVIGLNLDRFNTNEEVLSFMADFLYKEGIVKDSFKEAIIKREKSFSTGLNIGVYGVAIPHTDVEHVNESSIGILTLQNPVTFKQMGDNLDVPVSIVCMLALKESHDHLEMLQKLMNLFQDENIIQKIINLTDSEDNKDKILEIFKDEEII